MKLRILMVLTLLLSCGGIRRATYDGSLLIGVEQNRANYREGDTLVVDFEITNNGVRDEYISNFPSSFMLWSRHPEDFSDWLTEPTAWFASSGNTDPDAAFAVIEPDQTKILSVPFVPLHDEMPYDSLYLLLLYRVTVKLDSVAVKYSIYAQDTIVVVRQK